jgi:hypothetical protein
MLGRRDPQQSLFSAANLPHRVPEDSFYGRMAEVSGVLFQDDDLKQLYDPANGRPSLPPPAERRAALAVPRRCVR